MSYRTILVHADNASNAPARIRLAAELAEQLQAHLIGAAMTGVPRYFSAGSPFGAGGAILDNYLRHVAGTADLALRQFRDIAAKAGVESWETRRREDDAYTGLCLQARYADLVVLGQADPDDHGEGGLMQDLPEHVVMNSGRPVLLVPYAGEFPTLGRQPLIAWNGSVEATRAVAGALPLLRRAKKATVAILRPAARSGRHGGEPAAELAQYLARYGVGADIISAPVSTDVGNDMLSLAAAISADLLVMGCYGHSRVREKILGGASSTVLATMTLPVLMAH
jgi:nucleotide-binding universal stress UspA family protein